MQRCLANRMKSYREARGNLYFFSSYMQFIAEIPIFNGNLWSKSSLWVLHLCCAFPSVFQNCLTSGLRHEHFDGNLWSKFSSRFLHLCCALSSVFQDCLTSGLRHELSGEPCNRCTHESRRLTLLHLPHFPLR